MHAMMLRTFMILSPFSERLVCFDESVHCGSASRSPDQTGAHDAKCHIIQGLRNEGNRRKFTDANNSSCRFGDRGSDRRVRSLKGEGKPVNQNGKPAAFAIVPARDTTPDAGMEDGAELSAA
jgi:hypothetical protein